MTRRKEQSTNSINRVALKDCALTYSLDLIGGRWKLLILCQLEEQGQRYSDLKKLVPNISERMLALQLREAEKDGLVTRTVHAGVPPCVEYVLTPIGQELIPLWKLLRNWGEKHKKINLPVS